MGKIYKRSTLSSLGEQVRGSPSTHTYFEGVFYNIFWGGFQQHIMTGPLTADFEGSFHSVFWSDFPQCILRGFQRCTYVEGAFHSIFCESLPLYFEGVPATSHFEATSHSFFWGGLQQNILRWPPTVSLPPCSIFWGGFPHRILRGYLAAYFKGTTQHIW